MAGQPGQKPMGPHPILVAGFLAGVALIFAACWWPSIHLMWQLPLGVLLALSSLGKMSAR